MFYGFDVFLSLSIQMKLIREDSFMNVRSKATTNFELIPTPTPSISRSVRWSNPSMASLVVSFWKLMNFRNSNGLAVKSFNNFVYFSISFVIKCFCSCLLFDGCVRAHACSQQQQQRQQPNMTKTEIYRPKTHSFFFFFSCSALFIVAARVSQRN